MRKTGALDARGTADRRYPLLPADTRALFEAYATGLNDYARAHPGEVKLARLFPVLRGLAGASDDGAPGEARARALAAAQALLARVAAHTRVVLWLDDLQWSDPGSGALLAAILTGPNPPALLCLAGCRRDDADTSAVLAALRTHVPTARAIELEPLATADGVALARAPGRDRAAESIAYEAGGSPFLLRELARLDGPTGGATAIDDLSIGGAVASASRSRRTRWVGRPRASRK